MRVCSKCKSTKDLEEFFCTKRNQDGTCKYFASWCKTCLKEADNLKRRERGIPRKKTSEIVCDTKLCLECNKFLSFEEFSKSTRGLAGLSSYCKKCSLIRTKATPEKAREYSAKYRQRNRERWRAMHRIHQFKRRWLIEVTSDGTVTDEFLKELYSREYCFWCRRFIEERDRTLEHVIELSKGGTHSANNIEMACSSCNSKRLGKHLKGETDG